MIRYAILDSRFTSFGFLFLLCSSLIPGIGCGGASRTEPRFELSIRPEVALFLAASAPLVAVSEGRADATAMSTGVTCSPSVLSVASAPSPGAPTTVEECALWVVPPDTVESGVPVRLRLMRESDGTNLALIIGRGAATGGKHMEPAVLILLDDDSDGIPTLFELAAGFPPLDAGLKPGMKEIESAASGAKRRLQPYLGLFPPLSFALTPPEAAITSEDVATEEVSFHLSAPEPVSGFLCSIDGSEFEVCSKELNLKSVREFFNFVMV